MKKKKKNFRIAVVTIGLAIIAYAGCNYITKEKVTDIDKIKAKKTATIQYTGTLFSV